MGSQRSLHNDIPVGVIIIVTVIIRVRSKELYSLLEWNLTWGGGRELLKPLLCMLSPVICTATDPISFPIPLLFSLKFLRMNHLFSKLPLSYTCRICDEENPQSGCPPPSDITRGRGSLRFKSPEACLGAGNPESRRVAVDLPQGVRAPSWGYPTLGLGKGPLNQWFSVPPPLASSGCQHSPSFNSRGLPGFVCPSLARLPATWPHLGRPLTPRVTQTLPFFVQAELCSRGPSPWVLPSACLESLHLLRL